MTSPPCTCFIYYVKRHGIIFGPKWKEVKGSWRKLHREMRWAEHVARMSEEKQKNCRKSDSLRPIWEDCITADLKKIKRHFMDWVQLAQDTSLLIGSPKQSNERSGSMKGTMPCLDERQKGLCAVELAGQMVTYRRKEPRSERDMNSGLRTGRQW
jgi:hypothetical protein